MLYPNLTFTLLSEQSFTVYGLVFNLIVVQYAALTALIMPIYGMEIQQILFTLPDSNVQTDLIFSNIV